MAKVKNKRVLVTLGGVKDIQLAEIMAFDGADYETERAGYIANLISRYHRKVIK